MIRQIKKSSSLDAVTRRKALTTGGLAAAASAMAGAGTLLRVGRALADETELKIGWIKPLTGPLASSFEPLYIPGDIAFAEINNGGGILGRKLVKVEADDEGSPAKGTVMTRKLIEQGVKFILGPVGSSQAISSLEVSTPAKIIQAAYATADDVGQGKHYPYHYQFNFSSAAQVQCHVQYLVALGVKKAGILVEDSAAGSSSRDAMRKLMPANGIEIVSEQVFGIKTADMTPFLRKLRADGVQAIDSHISNNGDVTQYLIGLSRLHWQPISVGHTGLLFGGTPGAIPTDARYKDVYAATYRALTYTDTDKPPPRVEAFARQIISSNVPDALLGPAATSPFYDFLIALKAAAEKAKSLDTEAVKVALDSGAPIEGLFGPMTFSAERHSAYGSDVVAMAVVNSTDEPLSKETKGLFRRRGLAVS
jgi:branched-chain amino acid transport system substrate-binding protein